MRRQLRQSLAAVCAVILVGAWMVFGPPTPAAHAAPNDFVIAVDTNDPHPGDFVSAAWNCGAAVFGGPLEVIDQSFPVLTAANGATCTFSVSAIEVAALGGVLTYDCTATGDAVCNGTTAGYSITYGTDGVGTITAVITFPPDPTTTTSTSTTSTSTTSTSTTSTSSTSTTSTTEPPSTTTTTEPPSTTTTVDPSSTSTSLPPLPLMCPEGSTVVDPPDAEPFCQLNTNVGGNNTGNGSGSGNAPPANPVNVTPRFTG